MKTFILGWVGLLAVLAVILSLAGCGPGKVDITYPNKGVVMPFTVNK